jgi:hypothetical protein
VSRLGNLLSGNSLLPIGEWDAQVATLSVFSRTGSWVSRWLTPKELAIAFDLPVALHKEWLSALKDLPFLNATLSKIIMSVSEAIGSSLAMLVQELANTMDQEDFGELPASLPPDPVTAQAGTW